MNDHSNSSLRQHVRAVVNKSNDWTLFEELPDSSTRTVITGDGALLPQPFHGLPTENVTEWTNYFKTYVCYKRLAPPEALELFKVLARGPLAAWITTLDPAVRNDPSQLSKQFYRKYLGSPTRQIRIGKDLFSRRQGPTESVDDFFVAVRSMAQQMDVTVSDDILRHTIMAGLRPAIAGIVMAVGRDTISFDDLLESARAAELMSASATAEVASVADLALQVQKLTDKIEKCTVREVRASRSPSPAPRQVSFDVRQRSPSPAARQQPVQPSSRQYNYVEPRRQDVYNRRYNGQQPPTRCSRCNLLHGSNDACTAMGKRCHGCGAYNHLIASCRSRRRPINQYLYAQQ